MEQNRFRYIQTYINGYFGRGSGYILYDLGCSGYETDINQCPLSGWNTNSCSHSDDVGVDCYRKSKLLYARNDSVVKIRKEIQNANLKKKMYCLKPRYFDLLIFKSSGFDVLKP